MFYWGIVGSMFNARSKDTTDSLARHPNFLAKYLFSVKTVTACPSFYAYPSGVLLEREYWKPVKVACGNVPIIFYFHLTHQHTASLWLRPKVPEVYISVDLFCLVFHKRKLAGKLDIVNFQSKGTISLQMEGGVCSRLSLCKSVDKSSLHTISPKPTSKVEALNLQFIP